MNREEIRELWAKYIDKSLKYSIKQPPSLFTEPKCATCTHWHLVDEDTLEIISIYSPKEYEQMCLGMEGKIIKAYEEDGQIVDTYNVHMFYGFCKRFPPTWPESDSITRIGLFTRANVMTPRLLSGYKFPFLPHEEQCGEWKQGQWQGKFVLKIIVGWADSFIVCPRGLVTAWAQKRAHPTFIDSKHNYLKNKLALGAMGIG